MRRPRTRTRWWLVAVAVSFVLGLVIGPRLPGWWQSWATGENATRDREALVNAEAAPPRLSASENPPGRTSSSPVPPRTTDDRTPAAPLDRAAVADLRARSLALPVAGIDPDDLHRSFRDTRDGTRMHEALDILAPRHTPVLAAEDGTIAKLFQSKAGGLTVYQFDPTSTYAYYYAHLERYEEGIEEGDRVKRGQKLGTVGTSGNAPPNTPHLHFAIFVLNDKKQWWQGKPVDPYDVFVDEARSQ